MFDWMRARTERNPFIALAVTVATGQSSGTATDARAKNGMVIGYYPTGNQDQYVDNIALNTATGVVTVTLAANATANNTYNIIIAKG